VNEDDSLSTQTSAPKPHPLGAVPMFAIVGFTGFILDSGVTAGLQGLGLAFAFARPPGVVLATVLNFLLNRRFTFQATHLPIWPAFARYVGVASLGLAVNYLTSLVAERLATWLGLASTPFTAPIFVALGVGAAMVLTFHGFRHFAFRDR
jgi:putative flippase GtrA